MKLFFLISFVLLSSWLRAQNPYILSFRSLTGDTIHMTDYTGKKVLILICNAAAPDTVQLRRIDSFYLANNSSLAVIAIPVDDFGMPLGDSSLSAYLTGSLGLHFKIAQTGTAAKSSTTQQPLLEWLTHVLENNHFDEDITKDGQMYMLNEQGGLFGLFVKETDPQFLDSASKLTVTQ